MCGTVLILGANGRFGRHAAEAFWNAGWRVRIFDRTSDNLDESARGADVIVNAWNPLYTDWAAQLPTLTSRVIAAAQNSGATVVVPGNVYVYGCHAQDRLTPQTAHGATNPLGRLRVEMEQAYRTSGVRTIILRAGDFMDTEASGNWFDQVIVKSLPKGRVTYPGPLNVPHAWAWLPDLARAAVALSAKRADLPRFADIGFAGYTLTGAELANAIGAANRISVAPRRMSWAPLYLAGPVWPAARKLIEMRYLWFKPHRIDEKSLQDALPEFRQTPLETALIRATAHCRPAPDFRGQTAAA